MTPTSSTDSVLLAHMRDCIARIVEYTADDRQRFETSRLVQDAVIRNLQTLAESSQRLSDAIKATEPQMPWRDLAGFRNIVVHAYLSLDLTIVWDIVERELPGLAAAVDRMIGNIPPPP